MDNKIKFTLALLLIVSLGVGCQPTSSVASGQKYVLPFVDPLTKVSPAELKKMESFAIDYYQLRLHQTAIYTKDLDARHDLDGYLASTAGGGPGGRGWWMAVVADHPVVTKSTMFLDDMIGSKGNIAIMADEFNFTIVDDQLGYVVNDQFVARPLKRQNIIEVIKTDKGYKIQDDNDFFCFGSLQGTGAQQFHSNLIVAEQDLPLFLKNIKPWYKKIPKAEQVSPKGADSYSRWRQ